MSQTEQGAPSANTRPNLRRPMELVGEQQTPDPPPAAGIQALMEANRTNPAATKTAPTPSQQFQQEVMHRSVWKAAVMGTLNALALVLGARLIVLVLAAGAIGLTLVALGRQDSWNTIAVLGVYTCGAVLVSWLVSSRK